MGIDMVSKKYSNDKTISHLNYSLSSCLYKSCLLFFYAPPPLHNVTTVKTDSLGSGTDMAYIRNIKEDNGKTTQLVQDLR